MALYTLGCKVNQYDSAGLAELFRRRGYEVVDAAEAAEVYIINSCAVTGRSEAKSRQAARRIKRAHPDAIVALVGCYPQVDPEGAGTVEGVDVVAGTGDRARLLDLVAAARSGGAQREVGPAATDFEELPATELEGRTRALIKVEDGCDAHCAYCVVPLARGPVRSLPPERVLALAEGLLARGFRELVLTGVRLGAYGHDLGTSLAALVVALGELGRFRLRLSSIEPEDLTPDLLRAYAVTAAVCPHLHLPLQSGNARVLAAMGRRYTPDAYARLLAEARAARADTAVTTDVIVGFPGESEEEFQETFAFVREQAFSRLHVFRYSPRPGTPAATWSGQVTAAVKARRSSMLVELGRELALAFHRRLLGRVVEVLTEEQANDGRLQGLTPNYVRVKFDGPGRAHEVVPVRVTAADPEGVTGVRAAGNGPATCGVIIE